MDFSVEGTEIHIGVHSAEHIHLRILGMLTGQTHLLLLLHKSQLVEHRGGAGTAGLRKAQLKRSLLRVISVFYVQIQQRRIRILGTEQLLHMCLFNLQHKNRPFPQIS